MQKLRKPKKVRKWEKPQKPQKHPKTAKNGQNSKTSKTSKTPKNEKRSKNDQKWPKNQKPSGPKKPEKWPKSDKILHLNTRFLRKVTFLALFRVFSINDSPARLFLSIFRKIKKRCKDFKSNSNKSKMRPPGAQGFFFAFFFWKKPWAGRGLHFSINYDPF